MKTAEALLEKAARRGVFAAATHAVLSGPAVDRVMKSEDRGSCGDGFYSAEQEAAGKLPKIKEVLSVAPLLARGIQSIHERISISELFV